jgi:hypothetical protein
MDNVLMDNVTGLNYFHLLLNLTIEYIIHY